MAIIMVAEGRWLNKLWFIPLGFIALHTYNIMRLTALTLINQNHHEWFQFMHGVVFKVGYYGFIFLLWVLWIRKIADYKRDRRHEG